MCGIVGIVGRAGAEIDDTTIRRMARAVSHRGPDGEGFYLATNVAIGHRRLAIIDIETGAQPMANEDQRIWLTCNGEIYNFRDLRKDLQARGHRFVSSSDNEVVLHAYEEWQEDCVNRLRGMFAFAIVDLDRQIVFLARDYFGIKPLYVLSTPETTAFASEIRPLTLLPTIDLTWDLEAIDDYLRLGYIPAPRTAFREVQKLPPGHSLTVSFDGSESRIREYWSLAIEPDYKPSRNDWLHDLDNVLRESVRAHLVSDVPYGAFLSGGIDSSAVVSYMVESLGSTFPVFTIGFDEDAFSEVEYARTTATRWGLDHHVEIVTPDALEILPDLVRHFGEPFADSSAIPTYYVSRLARRHVPMVLSGDGGDEMFLGYDNYARWLRWLSFDGSSRLKNWLRPLARRLNPDRFPARDPNLQNWMRMLSLMNMDQRAALWKDEFKGVPRSSVEAFESAFEHAAGQSPAAMVAHIDRLTYLPNDILTKVDVASMAHGLEVRTPLVDRRVAEFAAKIPESFNMTHRGEGHWTGKQLLKQVLRQHLPEDIIQRPKKGFSVPIDEWFAPGTPLRNHLSERIEDRSSSLHEFFEITALRQHLTSERGTQMWQLLVLDEWFRQLEC